MIKTYPDKAAYDAAAKSKMESTVGLIESTGKVVIDGVNVVTMNPKVGDIACHDENRKVRFIALDTFEAGTFPSAWETVGVVVLRKGNKVTICSKYNESKKFMKVYPYIVSGYQLDGAEHTAQLRLHGRPGTDSWYEFKYTASTDSEFVEQLKQFLADNGETDWSAYQMDGKVILQYDNYESLEWYTVNVTYATGLTLDSLIDITIEKTPSFQLRHGDRGFGVWHPERQKEFLMTDSKSDHLNPSEDVEKLGLYAVCWPAFAGTSQYNEDHCLWLREKYCKDPNHPTVAEWENYIDSYILVGPCMTGGLSPELRDGRTISSEFGAGEYMTGNGKKERLYKGVGYCLEFFDGKGYMPSMSEFIEAFSKVTYGLSGVKRDNADPINRSLYAIGGNSVACNVSYWVAGRAAAHASFNCGAGGNNDHQGYNAEVCCVPFADIDLSELTED